MNDNVCVAGLRVFRADVRLDADGAVMLIEIPELREPVPPIQYIVSASTHRLFNSTKLFRPLRQQDGVYHPGVQLEQLKTVVQTGRFKLRDGNDQRLELLILAGR